MRKLLWFCLVASAFGQNIRYDGIAWGPRGPVPNASIAVCSPQPANVSASPCTPTANLCSSLTDVGCVSPNPLTADSLGNFHFYIPTTAIPFTVQIYGPQVASPYVMTDQGVGAGGTVIGSGSTNNYAGWNGPTNLSNAPATFSGNNSTFAGSISTAADGVHAGSAQLIGNTTPPSLGSNTFSVIGPNSASFTAYGIQFPSTSPTNGQVPTAGTPAGGITPITWATPAGAGCGSGTSGNLMEFTGTSTCGNAPIVDGGATGLTVTTPTTGKWNVGTQGSTSGQLILDGATNGVNFLGSIPLSQIGGAGAFSYCEWQSGGSGNFICKTLNSGGTSPALQLKGTTANSSSTWAIEDSVSKNGICGIATGSGSASDCVGGGPTSTGIEFRADTGSVFNFRIAGSSTNVTTISNTGVLVQAGQQFKSAPGAFSTLATCNAGNEGAMAAVNNSTTATWGATITGGGTNHVLAYCDGTNWTVAAL